jgi:hypothetical protein
MSSNINLVLRFRDLLIMYWILEGYGVVSETLTRQKILPQREYAGVRR